MPFFVLIKNMFFDTRHFLSKSPLLALESLAKLYLQRLQNGLIINSGQS
jgi:hypothetical protein